MIPILQHLPDFLKTINHSEPKDSGNTATQVAFGTKLSFFEWFKHEPERSKYLQQCLAAYHGVKPSFLDAYPLSDKIENGIQLSADRPLFVDVGGGFGPQSIAFKKRWPDLPGRVIIEDLSATIEQAQKYPGVKTLAQDFFEPQKVKGQSV